MVFGQSDFSIDALYEALDAQRQARALTWQQVMREINRQFEKVPARPISASTITGMRNKGAIEGDGVLQMLRWLGRTPESFVPGLDKAQMQVGALPYAEPHQILRFDTRALYLALDAKRVASGITWVQVAREVGGINPANLTRLAKPGGRVTFPTIMRITHWLGQSTAHFTRISDR